MAGVPAVAKDDNPETIALWRVRKTIHAMLNERGYLLTQDDMTMSKEDFITTFGDNPPYEHTGTGEREGVENRRGIRSRTDGESRR